jgi:hypothetical protein
VIVRMARGIAAGMACLHRCVPSLGCMSPDCLPWHCYID